MWSCRAVVLLATVAGGCKAPPDEPRRSAVDDRKVAGPCAVTSKMRDGTTEVVTSRYDDAGRLIEEWRGDALIRTLAYDDQGRLATVTRDGKTATYAYGAGTMTITEGTHVTRHTYDEHGRLVRKATDGGSTTTFTYDDDGRLVREEQDGGVFQGADGVVDEVTTVERRGGGDELRRTVDAEGHERFRVETRTDRAGNPILRRRFTDGDLIADERFDYGCWVPRGGG